MSSACPICGKPQDPAYRPFCSRRCADVDLQRWLTGSYSIEGRDGELEAAEDEDRSSAPHGRGADGEDG